MKRSVPIAAVGVAILAAVLLSRDKNGPSPVASRDAGTVSQTLGSTTRTTVNDTVPPVAATRATKSRPMLPPSRAERFKAVRDRGDAAYMEFRRQAYEGLDETTRAELLDLDSQPPALDSELVADATDEERMAAMEATFEAFENRRREILGDRYDEVIAIEHKHEQEALEAVRGATLEMGRILNE